MFGGNGNIKSFGTDGSGNGGGSFGDFGCQKIGIGLLGGGLISCTGLTFALGSARKMHCNKNQMKLDFCLDRRISLSLSPQMNIVANDMLLLGTM
uniref:Uncharacterized protein n=1 Tax=Solanum lycopersicum TaxID=4081 RepID=A0A3Q7G0W2_SOLLC